MPYHYSMPTEPRSRSEEKAADLAVKKTLSYRSIFNYPMSYFQIGTFLITNRKVSSEFLDKSVKKLTKQNEIKSKDQKYFLKSVKPLSWDLRHKNSQGNMKRSQYIFNILNGIPWIKMVAITGSAAANNMDKKDDLDIFVITEKNRLWLTRFFTVLFLKGINKYRTDKNPSEKICPNIFIDEESMAWRNDKRNLYVAHEIMMMHPVINRDNTYFKFIRKNDWVYDFFANNKPDFLSSKSHEKSTKVKRSRILDKLEKALMAAQLKYMHQKKPDEITRKDIIHFNKNDWTENILKDYKTIISKLGY